MTDTERVAIDLTDEERMLMIHGLNEYFGAAKRGWSLLVPLLGYLLQTNSAPFYISSWKR